MPALWPAAHQKLYGVLLVKGMLPRGEKEVSALAREVIDLITFYQVRGWDWRTAVEFLIWKSERV
jgi:hypothetical protein